MHIAIFFLDQFRNYSKEFFRNSTKDSSRNFWKKYFKISLIDCFSNCLINLFRNVRWIPSENLLWISLVIHSWIPGEIIQEVLKKWYKVVQDSSFLKIVQIMVSEPSFCDSPTNSDSLRLFYEKRGFVRAKFGKNDLNLP